jgi:hypothetical protein
VGRAWNAHVYIRIASKNLIGKPEGKRYLKYLGVDGRKILKRI